MLCYKMRADKFGGGIPIEKAFWNNLYRSLNANSGAAKWRSIQSENLVNRTTSFQSRLSQQLLTKTTTQAKNIDEQAIR